MTAAPSAKRQAGSTAKPAPAATPGQANSKQDQTGTGHKPAAGPSTASGQRSAHKPGSTPGKVLGAKGSGTGGKPAARAAGDLPTKSAHPNIKIRDDGKFRVFLSSQGLKYLHGEQTCGVLVPPCGLGWPAGWPDRLGASWSELQA
jgi:hypothetical protein